MNRILIVDDDEATRKLASLTLQRAGYDIGEYQGSIEALGAVGSNPPALVLSNIALSGVDGFGLLSALRARPDTANMPVILMTLRSDHAEFRKAMKLGADDYLTKPLDRVELVDAVRARLARVRAGAPPAAAPNPTPAPADLKAVIRLTDYTLVRKIAEGGMSAIYLADQKSTARRVVLKLFPITKGMAQDAVDRFVQEHKMLERLHHPNIVEIYAQGFNDEHLYIAMEYFENGSLNEHLEAALPEGLAFRYAIQIAKGLEAAHRAGIVHRDLKPDNVMVRKNGTLALTDFGIAKDLNSSSSLTQFGEVLGTPSYVAPEQAQGQPVGPAADVYSLGVLLFQMLTGRKPYQANDPQNILYQHINSPIPRLPEDLAQWQDVIDFMMNKSPLTRPRDASAVLAVFRAFGFE